MLKKILIGLLLGCLVVGMALPVFAQEEIPEKCIIRKDPGITDCPTSGDCVYETNALCGLCCLMSTIYYVTDWIFTFLMVLVIMFVLLGAFEILTAAGDSDKVTKGRNYILYAAVGLGVALLARAVPAIVRYMVAPGV